jgi:hypothetical protein
MNAVQETWKRKELLVKDSDYECCGASGAYREAKWRIRKHATILSSSPDTIEACGGGSRCMMAEISCQEARKYFKRSGTFTE